MTQQATQPQRPNAMAEATARAVRERVRSDVGFADVLVDARNPHVMASEPSATIVERFHGAPAKTHKRVEAPGEGGLVTFEFWSSLRMASSLWLFEFPDGFRLAVLTQGDLATGPADNTRVIVPLERALNIYKHPKTPRALAATARGVRNAAQALRAAASDPHGWLAGYEYGSGPCRYISEPLMLMVENACYGIDSYEVAHRYALRHGGLGPRQCLVSFADAGFDINRPDHADWFDEAQVDGWDLRFTLTSERLEPWEHLRSLYDAHWSLAAVRHLHYDIVDRTGGFHYTTPPAWAAVPGGADDWVTAAGSPQMASLCIEAGLGPAEARSMVHGPGLDEDALRVLAAFKVATSSTLF